MMQLCLGKLIHLLLVYNKAAKLSDFLNFNPSRLIPFTKFGPFISSLGIILTIYKKFILMKGFDIMDITQTIYRINLFAFLFMSII